MRAFDVEAKLIQERYVRRETKDKQAYYSAIHPSASTSFLEKYTYITKLLAKNFGYDFCNKRYLEVGCGSGTNLLLFLMLGINPENLSGNDIFVPSLSAAKLRLPVQVSLQEGNFLDLTYDKDTYDVILLSTVLSSILDKKFQGAVMQRCYDLLKTNGIILFYDFQYNNPRNKDVHGVNMKFLKSTAPWKQTKFHRVTLCPPLSRKLAFSLTLHSNIDVHQGF